MRLIDPFFQKLQPSIKYLCHEVIIAQAWKKTHAYIRTHNWYADTLALDVSALVSRFKSSAVWYGNLTLTSDKVATAIMRDSLWPCFRPCHPVGRSS